MLGRHFPMKFDVIVSFFDFLNLFYLCKGNKPYVFSYTVLFLLGNQQTTFESICFFIAFILNLFLSVGCDLPTCGFQVFYNW